MAEDQRLVFKGILARYKIDSPELQTLINDAVINSTDVGAFTEQVFASQTFKTAFPEYWARIEANKPTMTPDQILEYRDTAKRLFANAGLPKEFWDEDKDIFDLIVNNVSPQELDTRITKGFERVAAAPQMIKDAFGSFFGASSEAALATLYLDPEKGSRWLMEKVTQAEIAGTGKRFGFDIGLTRAEELQKLGIGLEQAVQGFGAADRMRGLADETISETADLTQRDLEDAVFASGPGAQTAIERRRAEREAALRGGGGATAGQSGFGFGSST